MATRDAGGEDRKGAARLGRSRLLAGLIAMLLTVPAATAAPLEKASQIGPALLRCWRPPAAPERSAVTLRFSFRRDGSLISARVTYVGVAGDAALKRQFAESAIRAIQECSPLELSPRFASTIGGRVYVMQFTIAKKQPTVRQMYA